MSMNVIQTQNCEPGYEYAKPNRYVLKCFANVSTLEETSNQQAKHFNYWDQPQQKISDTSVIPMSRYSFQYGIEAVGYGATVLPP